MPDQPPPLGPDDYRQLYQMSLSQDPSVRDQASTLSKKLTPDEQKAFFNFQRGQHPHGELGRVDNSVLGVPPELAVVGALGVGRAMAAPALSNMARVGAGVKAVASQATPVLKYEITKTGLQAIGVPPGPATIAAMIIAGYKRGGSSSAPTARGTTALPEGVEPYMPNVSAGPVSYGPSAAGIPTTVAEPYAPNISSGEAPSYAPPANVPNRPWGSGVPAPSAPVVDPHMPNVSVAVPTPAPAGQSWAAELAENPDRWRVDPHMPNVSADPTVGYAEPAAVIPPATKSVPASFAELMKPPPPEALSKVEQLIKAGKKMTDAIRQVAGKDTTLGAQLTSALTQK